MDTGAFTTIAPRCLKEFLARTSILTNISVMRHGLTILGALVLLSCLTIAQSKLTVDVSLVNLAVTVTDLQGRHVPGLQRERFLLEEDGKLQEIVHITDSSDLPVSVGILVDASASMDTLLEPVKTGVEQFVMQLPANDEVFLMTFNSAPLLHQSFTTDRGRLIARLRKIIPSGGTRLASGLISAIADTRTGKHERKALLLFSDGFDARMFQPANEEFAEMQSQIRMSRIAIYPVATGSQPRGLQNLRTIAEISAGKVWVLRSQAELTDILKSLAEELRHQYLIGYYPGHKVKDGKMHRVNLTLREPLPYTLRYRKEYSGQ